MSPDQRLVFDYPKWHELSCKRLIPALWKRYRCQHKFIRCHFLNTVIPSEPAFQLYLSCDCGGRLELYAGDLSPLFTDISWHLLPPQIGAGLRGWLGFVLKQER